MNNPGNSNNRGHKCHQPVTKTSKIVLVSTKPLALGLRLVLAERLVYDRPDHVVVLHDECGGDLDSETKYIMDH